ncbi:membrane protein [Bacillus phage YungSlug]|nr:membrane protein [Bacillus phage YungSlug]
MGLAVYLVGFACVSYGTFKIVKKKFGGKKNV